MLDNDSASPWDADNFPSFLIGITGGYSVGKSTVIDRLVELGFQVIDADKEAHELLKGPCEAYYVVLAHFGFDLCDTPGGPIDRQKLRQRALADPKSKAMLEDIMFPAVAKRNKERVADLSGQGQNLIPIEVPLLFEAGLQRNYDEIWCVVASEAVQVQRAMARNNLSEQEARKRIADHGFTQKQKADLSDRIIDNSGSKADCFAQVDKLLALAKQAALVKRQIWAAKSAL